MLEKHSVYVAVDALVHDCAERTSWFFASFLKREEINVFVISHVGIIYDISRNDKCAEFRLLRNSLTVARLIGIV